jgi:hypothetical protein
MKTSTLRTNKNWFFVVLYGREWVVGRYEGTRYVMRYIYRERSAATDYMRYLNQEIRDDNPILRKNRVLRNTRTRSA